MNELPWCCPTKVIRTLVLTDGWCWVMASLDIRLHSAWLSNKLLLKAFNWLTLCFAESMSHHSPYCCLLHQGFCFKKWPLAKQMYFLEKDGVCGLQWIRADQVSLWLIFIDFRAKCCDVFYFTDFERIGLNFGFYPWGPGWTRALFCGFTQSTPWTIMLPQAATA